MSARKASAASAPAVFVRHKRHDQMRERFDRLHAELSKAAGVSLSQVQVVEWLMNYYEKNRCRDLSGPG